MNRKQRRSIKKLERKNQAKTGEQKSPSLQDDMVELAQTLFGNCDDVEILKALNLACVVRPEPIHIAVFPYNEELFQERYNQQQIPAICIVQEEDGTFSKIFANQNDWTRLVEELEFAQAESWNNPFPLSQDILNIESIKVLNFHYEALGIKLGNLEMLKVCIYIYSKMPSKKVLEQGNKFNAYFESKYQGMRRLFYGALVPENIEVAKNFRKPKVA